jgi:hypothetical protein
MTHAHADTVLLTNSGIIFTAARSTPGTQHEHTSTYSPQCNGYSPRRDTKQTASTCLTAVDSRRQTSWSRISDWQAFGTSLSTCPYVTSFTALAPTPRATGKHHTTMPTALSIDRPFIVLTETKFSKRHIPVWARYSPLRTRVEAHANTLSP